MTSMNSTEECEAAYLTATDSLSDLISEEKFAEALCMSGRNPSQKQLKGYYKHSVGGGKLNFTLFCRAMEEISPHTTDQLMKAFRAIDLDGNGYLTEDELMKVLTKNGEAMSPAEVKSIMKEADRNGDGVLDYEEFCSMMVSTAETTKYSTVNKLKEKKRAKEREDELREVSVVKPAVPKSAALKGSKDSLVSSGSKSNLAAKGVKGSSGSVKSTASSAAKRVTKTSKEFGSNVSLNSFKSTSTVSKKKSAASRETASNSSLSSFSGSRSSRKDLHDSKKSFGVFGSNKSSKSSLSKKLVGSKSVSKESLLSTESAVSKATADGPTKEEDDDDDDDDAKSKDDGSADEDDVREDDNDEEIVPVQRGIGEHLPAYLKDWFCVVAKGFTQFDDTKRLISTQFKLSVKKESKFVIDLEKIDDPRVANINPDFGLIVLLGDTQDIDDDPEIPVKDAPLPVIDVSESGIGKCSFEVTLRPGVFTICPMSFGTHFRYTEDSSSSVAIKKGNSLTPLALQAIEEVFMRFDMEMNRALTKDEFDLIQLITNHEKCEDETWSYMVKKFDTNKGGLTKKGFVELYRLMMEMEGSDSVRRDLEALGYNRALEIQWACPFDFQIFSESVEVDVEILPHNEVCIQGALFEHVREKGSEKKLSDDVNAYVLETKSRVITVVENKDEIEETYVNMDCKLSSNLKTNRNDLNLVLKVGEDALSYGHILVVEDEKKPYVFDCKMSLV
eukprot:Nk52_evm37s250 gene=Nk52_evmTU37s250